MADALAMAEGGTADKLVLLAGAYFHDVVNPPKDSPLRSQASRLAAAKAVELLTEMDFDTAKLDGVAHAIAAHSFSAGIPTETPEAKILQDADRMEALGAIGLARVFYVSGRLNRPPFDAVDPLCKNRTPDDSLYGVDHFFTKLLKLPAQMQTESGKRMAAERAEVLTGYLQTLERELTAPAP
ncbi:MAG: HD domain-containing protein [Proteobacteria bacterium]|nr:HD domain-containing protein [Pseudomonadota bacterium]